MIHEIENSDDSQKHLNENIEKFNGDCKRVMEILYSGKRLSAKSLVQEYGIADRRLRDVITALPNVVKKRWLLNDKGKRTYVEYFIEIPMPAGKLELVEWAGEFLEQQSLF